MKNTFENSVSEEEREVVLYGLAQGKMWLLCVVITLIIGILFNVFVESIIFFVGLTALRIYAGGYHARTRACCGILSFLVLCAGCFFCRFFQVSRFAFWLFSSLSCIGIFFLSPVDTLNKRFDSLEKGVYGKKAKIVALAEYIVFVGGCIFQIETIFMPVGFVFFIEFLFLLAGVLQNRRENV